MIFTPNQLQQKRFCYELKDKNQIWQMHVGADLVREALHRKRIRGREQLLRLLERAEDLREPRNLAAPGRGVQVTSKLQCRPITVQAKFSSLILKLKCKTC